jgi:hypothetical protein
MKTLKLTFAIFLGLCAYLEFRYILHGDHFSLVPVEIEVAFTDLPEIVQVLIVAIQVAITGSIIRSWMRSDKPAKTQSASLAEITGKSAKMLIHKGQVAGKVFREAEEFTKRLGLSWVLWGAIGVWVIWGILKDLQ